MKFGYNGYWAEFPPPDIDWMLRNLLPETPKEMVDRFQDTRGWTPLVPLPRGLSKTLREFDW